MSELFGVSINELLSGKRLSEAEYKAAAEEKEKSTQLSIEFDERIPGEGADTEERINPDRTGVKLEEKKSSLNIKVMDRSGEAVGRIGE